jgi:hypothetical protein
MADPDVSIKIGIDDKEALAKADALQKKLDAKLKDALKAKISTSVDQREFDEFATKFKSSVKSLQDGAKLNLGIKLDDAGQIAAFKTKVEQLRKESSADINVKFNIKQDTNAVAQVNKNLKLIREEATDLSNRISFLKFEPKVNLKEIKTLKAESDVIQKKLLALGKTGVDIKTDVSQLNNVNNSLSKIQNEIQKTKDESKKLKEALADSLKIKLSSSIDFSEFNKFANDFKSSVKDIKEGTKLNLSIKLDDAGQIAEYKKKVDQLRSETKQDINVRFNIKQDLNVFNQINQSIKSVKDEATNLSNKVSLLKFQPKVDLSDVKKLKTEAEAIQQKIIELSKTGVDIKTDVSKLNTVDQTLSKIQAEIERTNQKGVSIKDGGSLNSISDKIGGINKLLNIGFVLKFTQVGLDGIIGMVQGLGQGLLGGIDMVSKLEGNQVALEQALFNQNKKGGQDAGTARINASKQSQTISDSIVKFAAETPFSSSNIFGLATQLQNRGFDVLAGTNGGQNKITGAGNKNILNVASDLISRQVLLGKTQDEAITDFSRAISEFKSGQYMSLKTRFDIGNPDIAQGIIDAGFGEKTGISKADDLSAEALQKLSPEDIVKVFAAISSNLGAEGLSGQQALTFDGLISTLKDGLDGLTRSFFGSAKDPQSLFSQMKGAIEKAIGFLDSAEGEKFKKQLGEIGTSIGSFIEQALTPENIKAFGEGLVTFGEAVKSIFSPENIANAVSFFETIGEKFKDGGLFGVLTTSGDEYMSKSVDKSINRSTKKISDIESELKTETDPVKRQALIKNLKDETNTLNKLSKQQEEVDREANKNFGERAGDFGRGYAEFQTGIIGKGAEFILGKKNVDNFRKERNKKIGLDENASDIDAAGKNLETLDKNRKYIIENSPAYLSKNLKKTFDTLLTGDFKGETFGQGEDSTFANIIVGIGETKEKVTNFFEKDIPNSLENAKTSIKTWFTDRYDDAVKWKDDIKTNVTDFINQDWQQVLEDMAYNAGEWIRNRYEDFIRFKDDTIQRFIDLKDGAIQKFNELSDFVRITFTETIPNFIKDIPGFVEMKFKEAKDFGVAKLGELKDFGIKKIQELKDFIFGVPKTVDDEFGKAKDNGNSKLKEIKDYANDRVEDIKKFFNDIPTTLENAFKDGKKKVQDQLDSMKTAVSNFAEDAKKSISGIGDSFMKGLTGQDREAKANGGAVFAGRDYTVAEEGRELFRSNDGDWKMLSGGTQPFTPDKSGFIFPNNITEQLLTRITPNEQNNTNNYNFNNKFNLPESSDKLQGYYGANKLLSEMDKQLRGQLA